MFRVMGFDALVNADGSCAIMSLTKGFYIPVLEPVTALASDEPMILSIASETHG